MGSLKTSLALHFSLKPVDGGIHLLRLRLRAAEAGLRLPYLFVSLPLLHSFLVFSLVLSTHLTFENFLFPFSFTSA